MQRKGPAGGARLKVAPKEIGMGDVYAAAEEGWISFGDDGGRLGSLEKRLRKDALAALNQTTLAQVTKRLKA